MAPGLVVRTTPSLPPDGGDGGGGGGGGGGVGGGGGGGGGGLQVSQACHISSSRSCPAPSWAPPPPSVSQGSSGQRLSNQLSVESGGSLSHSHSRGGVGGVPPPAYSEASQHRGGTGLSAPSFTTLTSLTSHSNNHNSHS